MMLITQVEKSWVVVKRPIHSEFNWAILLCDFIPHRKNWIHCAVHSGNPHSFLSLRADTTMASSQGTSASSHSFSRWTSHDIFLFKYHFLLHILRFLFFFSDNIMTDVASKEQTTALFLSTTITRTRRHRELTKKTDKPDGKPVLCQRTFSSAFRAVFFLHS